MIVAKQVGDAYEYIGGTMKNDRDVWKEFKALEKGDYIVFVEIDWN